MLMIINPLRWIRNLAVMLHHSDVLITKPITSNVQVRDDLWKDQKGNLYNTNIDSRNIICQLRIQFGSMKKKLLLAKRGITKYTSQFILSGTLNMIFHYYQLNRIVFCHAYNFCYKPWQTQINSESKWKTKDVNVCASYIFESIK